MSKGHFALLVDIPIGIVSFVVWLKKWLITLGVKTFSQ